METDQDRVAIVQIVQRIDCCKARLWLKRYSYRVRPGQGVWESASLFAVSLSWPQNRIGGLFKQHISSTKLLQCEAAGVSTEVEEMSLHSWL